MGPIKSVWMDKLRREWQMKQSFKISNSIYEPDIVVFLGDILDEGSYSNDESFDRACDDFFRIFSVDRSKQEVHIIPGNHDVGFHDHMLRYPYLLDRFSKKFGTTSNVQLIESRKVGSLELVMMNSMSFNNDGCPFCTLAIQEINRIASHIERMNKVIDSRPIVFKHIPLYRRNDSSCKYPQSMADRVVKPNIEGEDVIHEATSRFILDSLRPRLVISGHTHMQCSTTHRLSESTQETIEELTITSYNHKYAELEPGFLLLSANSTHLYTQHCGLVNEYIICLIYIIMLLLILLDATMFYRTAL